ncbi:NUDIX hydrolase [Nocardia cyriacigeorgica]|uniref:NUDIX hydrolase n=1 Tax=Nocardia cyriacigeorgica TaxID=135487 RepID=UPI002455428A|nr:NUDIX domain-containing protein [Nocardia cyriacigeorgica]
MHHPRIRVAAYVIRYRTTPQLLVFDHVGLPEAGTQIPAGGAHPGEALDTAVLREVGEETGLRNVSVVEQLAVDDHAHSLTHHPRRTTFFRLHARPDTPDTWTHRVDGDGADHGLIFTCRFVRLPLKSPLADQQDRWLSRIAS